MRMIGTPIFDLSLLTIHKSLYQLQPRRTREHQKRALTLAERLRKDGVDAQLDQYVAGASRLASLDGWSYGNTGAGYNLKTYSIATEAGAE